MTTTYSLSMRYWEGTPGDPAVKNVWGTALDTNFTLVDQSFNAANQINIAGLSTYTLTTANGAPDQARQAVLNFQGALTANCVVTLPNVPRVGWVVNNTTGGFSVILATGVGAETAIPPDGVFRLYVADGINSVVAVNLSQPTSGALTGTSLVVNGSAQIFGTVQAAGQISSQLGVSAPFLSGTTLTLSGNANISGNTVTPASYQANGNFSSVTITGDADSVFVNSAVAPPGPLTAFKANLAANGSFYAGWFFGGTIIGSIQPQSGGTGVNYNTTSDARLKNNVAPITDVGKLIDRLKPRWFTWRSDPEAEPEPGFFAQEAHRVWRWCVTKGRGRPGQKNYSPWQMDNAKLVPLLVAELQELRCRVKALEAAQ